MIVFSLLTSFLPMVIIIFIVFYAVKNKEKGGELIVRNIYTYLVLFATLMMVIGGGISIFMAAADFVSPSGYYQSYAEYKETTQYDGKDEVKKEQISEKELRESYDEMIIEEKARTKENAVNQIIKSLGFIVIPLPVFLYFNKQRKRLVE
ncbi:hypothetical protein [Mesobacillus zeae]|uniref:DUF5671 domain-containing protein n=1 Tax=Mesobacillus zeae TaxID=1917180 RepID=A0A398BD75_9BACI|nr:hypothetical protein [Mesobacillus zeae]RID88085.1 hypothetical protein D1970_04425 [Mesobacillus zeae]